MVLSQILIEFSFGKRKSLRFVRITTLRATKLLLPGVTQLRSFII